MSLPMEEKRKIQNDDWKPLVQNQIIGPARFIKSDDLHLKTEETYKRVTRAEAEAGKECRVYADGIYDVFHSGHARQLMQAKNMFPNVVLIVGCCDDALTHSKKGKTVCTDEERYEALRHCRYVDIILPSAPWGYSEEFFDKHKIDFIAHDDEPYTIGMSANVTDSYALPKSKDMFCATQRTEGISTSDIITRIVKNYDTYIRRNLSRGMTRKDLNVGPVHSARLKMENKIKGTIEHVNHDIADTYNWTKSVIKTMAESQVSYVRSFLETYAPNNTPEGVLKVLDAISPPQSPRSLSRRNSTEIEEGDDSSSLRNDLIADGRKLNEGVDASELSAALQK